MKIENAEALESLFEAQGEARWAIASTNANERVAKLESLRRAILARRDGLYEALWSDFRKSSPEAWLTEIFPTIEEIGYAAKRLGSWMRGRRARGTFFLPGARSRLRYEPKGRVLIMAPWNYPFQLALAPLVSALAAGNTVILKPSNKTPATSAFIASLLEPLFPPEEVAVVEGPGRLLGELLLELPFDHLFFTGSPRVGARVGEAAARLHAGLTLELGGKSPCVMLPDADLEKAAAKIMWAKCLNAGQTCVAPDYLFCPRPLVPAFAAAAEAAVRRMYGADEEARRASPDFPRIVDREACSRHASLVEDAVAKGARLEFGGRFDPDGRYSSPTLLTGVRPEMAVMDEEIFGPILPVLAYDEVEEAVEFIRSRPKPLALYAFGSPRRAEREILERTSSGSACVNDLILQVENLDLPFGGVGMSGTGSYHGFQGFRTFSHERNVMVQGPWSPVSAFYPPYGRGLQGRLRALVEAALGLRA